MLEVLYFKSALPAFLCVFCLLVSELLSVFFCPSSLRCVLVVVSWDMLVALGSWLSVPFMVSSSLFSVECSQLVVIRLLR